MAYPAFVISMDESEYAPLDNLEVDEWPNGSVRGRAFSDAQRFQWTVVHPALTEADRVTLEAYYWANRTVPFDFSDRFVSPAVTRNNVIFTAVPRFKRNTSSGKNRTWKATVSLRSR